MQFLILFGWEEPKVVATFLDLLIYDPLCLFSPLDCNFSLGQPLLLGTAVHLEVEVVASPQISPVRILQIATVQLVDDGVALVRVEVGMLGRMHDLGLKLHNFTHKTMFTFTTCPFSCPGN